MSHIFFQNFSMNEWGSLIAHIYSVAKATTLVYLFHERSYVASLVGIAAILIKLRLLIQQYFDIADYVGSPSITVVKEGLAGTYTNFKILQCPQYWIFLVFSWNCLDFEKKSKRYAQLPIGVNNPASVTKFASAVLESWFRAHNSRIIIADK